MWAAGQSGIWMPCLPAKVLRIRWSQRESGADPWRVDREPGTAACAWSWFTSQQCGPGAATGSLVWSWATTCFTSPFPAERASHAHRYWGALIRGIGHALSVQAAACPAAASWIIKETHTSTTHYSLPHWGWTPWSPDASSSTSRHSPTKFRLKLNI